MHLFQSVSPDKLVLFTSSTWQYFGASLSSHMTWPLTQSLTVSRGRTVVKVLAKEKQISWVMTDVLGSFGQSQSGSV